MSDNTRINPGVGGDNIATEDMGAYKVPVVKIRVGANDVDAGDITASNPLPAQLSQGSAAVTAANPVPTQLSQANAAASATNPIPAQLSQSNAAVSFANPLNASVIITDGVVSATKTSVGAFHNSDNQTLPASGGSLLTGGVPQLTNPTGTADRARGTGVDGVPAVGIPCGSAQSAQAIKTTVAVAISVTGSQAVTPASMTNIFVGSILTIDVGGTNQENVFVTATTSTTFTANFTKTHTTVPFIVKGFVYNQARDASGELDGANGLGTTIAAGYEYNGGSPGGGFFDRERTIQGKGVGSSTLTASLTGGTSTSLALAAVVGLNPGQPLYLNAAGSTTATTVQEVVYVDINYVPGALTVPLQSAVVNNHTSGDTVRWDTYSASGPGLNGFYMVGMGIEEEALWDPVSGQFYIERAATQDAMPLPNIVAENPALYNGTTMDRARSGSAANLSAFSATGSELCVKPGNWSVNASATAGTPSASKAAGGAGVRHVCNSISITLATGATAQTPVLVNLRDGASGAGTVLQTWAISAVANGGMAVVTITDLNVVGSAATAMTLEFAGATAGSTVATVNLNGYDTV